MFFLLSFGYIFLQVMNGVLGHSVYKIGITIVFLTANRNPGTTQTIYGTINESSGIPGQWMDWTCGHRVRTLIEYIMSTIFFINHTQCLISAQNIGSLSGAFDDTAIYRIYYICLWLCYLHFCIETVGKVERISWI